MPPSPARDQMRRRAVRFHRPDDLVERTRWLFGVCALVSLLLTCAGLLAGGGTWQPAACAVSTAALTASWLHRYLTRRARIPLDLLDAAAVGLLALASPVPAVALAVTFSALWFRAVYGRTWEICFYATAQCAALVAALVWWQAVPGHDTSAPAGPLLGALPMAPLLAIVARHLATVLFERQQAQACDAALVRLGTHLLGVTDTAEIEQRAWETTQEICRVTPGLRAVHVADGDDRLRVLRSVGPPGQVPVTLDRTWIWSGPDNTAGAPGGWTAVPFPDAPGQYMLVGGAAELLESGLAAIRSLLNQVAMAIRAATAHLALEAQARTDALTGLANRSAFSTALGPAGAADRWVLFVDLDDFKAVNDRFGHAAGDELLRIVAARLAGTVRSPDLCARLGGDEFAVLVHVAGADEAQALALRLIDVVSAPVSLAGGTAQVGVSVGAAHVVPGQPWTDTLREADLAMYAAKAAGKNRVRVAADVVRADQFVGR